MDKLNILTLELLNDCPATEQLEGLLLLWSPELSLNCSHPTISALICTWERQQTEMCLPESLHVRLLANNRLKDKMKFIKRAEIHHWIHFKQSTKIDGHFSYWTITNM